MLTRIAYSALNSRQKENFNFHRIAARLAEYGHHSMRLTDDFQGADFIALYQRAGSIACAAEGTTDA